MKEVRLGDYITLGGGGTPSKKVDSFWNGDISWASVKDFKSDYISSTQDKITIEGVNNSATRIVPSGTLLIATRMAVGKVAFSQIDIAINQDLKAITCSNELSKRFLFYQLKSKSKYFERVSSGATVKGIKIGHILDLKIPLPPLPTQKKIAAILDAADKYRQLTKTIIEKYDQLAQALFLDMFGEYSEQELIPLKENITFSQGQQFPIEEQSLVPEEGYARFLRIVDFTQGDDFRYVPNENDKYYIQKDDIVIVRYGASAGFVGTNKEGVLANNLFKLKFNRNQFSHMFLFYTFMGKRFKSFVQKEAFGAAMPALSFKVMERFKILVPPINLQNQFTDRIQLIEQQKQQAQISLQKAEDLFNSLLQRAFKGELVS